VLQLRASAWLEVRQQAELVAVAAALLLAAERNDAVGWSQLPTSAAPGGLGSSGRSPHTRHARSATLSRCASDAALNGTRRRAVYRTSRAQRANGSAVSVLRSGAAAPYAAARRAPAISIREPRPVAGVRP
jgi:hypothetical protein